MADGQARRPPPPPAAWRPARSGCHGQGPGIGPRGQGGPRCGREFRRSAGQSRGRHRHRRAAASCGLADPRGRRAGPSRLPASPVGPAAPRRGRNLVNHLPPVAAGRPRAAPHRGPPDRASGGRAMADRECCGGDLCRRQRRGHSCNCGRRTGRGMASCGAGPRPTRLPCRRRAICRRLAGRRRRARRGPVWHPRVWRSTAWADAMSVAAAAAGSQGLWFVSRATGLALLVLFSAVMVLGVAARLGSAPRRWPRFVSSELHRALALFSVAFLALHVVTAILDPFVSIGWAATVLPFASGYRTLAIGLGTLAVDLGGAVLLASLVRVRLGFRAWRAVHWLAYLAWPVAFVHSL